MLRSIFGRSLAVLALASCAVAALPASANAQTNFIQSKATGYYLDSNNDGRAYTYGHNGGSPQKWTLIPSDDGYYFLKNEGSDLYLDSNSNKQVYTHGYNGGSPQKWKLIPSGDGYYFLKNKSYGFVLDTNTSNDVYTNPYSGNSYQQWQLRGTNP